MISHLKLENWFSSTINFFRTEVPSYRNSANQWTSFYMIETSVIKKFNKFLFWSTDSAAWTLNVSTKLYIDREYTNTLRQISYVTTGKRLYSESLRMLLKWKWKDSAIPIIFRKNGFCTEKLSSFLKWPFIKVTNGNS